MLESMHSAFLRWLSPLFPQGDVLGCEKSCAGGAIIHISLLMTLILHDKLHTLILIKEKNFPSFLKGHYFNFDR